MHRESPLQETHAGTTTFGARAQLSNRRRYTRHHLEIRVSYPQRNSFFSEYTRNISHGGMFIATHKPLPEGTKLQFVLEIPGEEAPLHLQGEVRWCVRPEDMVGIRRPMPDLEPGMGIAFCFETTASREAFAQRVEAMAQST